MLAHMVSLFFLVLAVALVGLRVLGLRVTGQCAALALCLTVATLAAPACTPGTSAAVTTAKVAKATIGAVADLGACSAASRGPLATYLSGNVSSARDMVVGAAGAGIVTDVLCALQAIANAIPDGEPAAPAIAGPGYVPGANSGVSAAVPTGAKIPRGERIPGVTGDARARAADILLSLCASDEGRAKLRAAGVQECRNVAIPTCVRQEAGQALRPGQQWCPL